MNLGEPTAHVPLIDVRNLCKTFVSKGLLREKGRVTAAREVSFRLDRGEAVALVGESGSGKSTIARLVLRLEQPDGGEIRLEGSDVLSREPRGASLAYRGRVQMVFQDPFGSLNPVHSIAHHLERPLLLHAGRSTGSEKGALNPAHDVAHHLERPTARHGRASGRSGLRTRVLELLETVGLSPAEDFVDRRPYELSGGQRQRVAIARALAVGPDLLVADEPTSMLDVSIRMGVLKLLARLKNEERLGILLITHDLASARYLANRILVLYRGRVVEDGPSEEVVSSPAHPYTQALLDSIAGAASSGPRTDPSAADPGSRREPAAEALEAADAAGCPFAPRCPEVLDVCREVDPAPRDLAGRRVRCHLHPIGMSGNGS